MNGPLDRVYALVERTLDEDEQPQSVAVDPEDPTVEARSTGYGHGWREARATFRSELTTALIAGMDDPYYIEVRPDWQGIYVAHGRSVMSQLSDDGGAVVSDSLTPIERRIMAARLRAWADHFDATEATS